MAIIGIDLGTTNSLVCTYKNGTPVFIPNRQGYILTPSCISVEGDTIFVGQAAKDRLVTNPKDTVASFKRFMATDKKFVLQGKTFLAKELSSYLVKNLVEDAKAYLNEEIDEAIISVPAYFDDEMRRETKECGKMAGVTVNRVINEPSSGALAYSYYHNLDMNTSIVIDLGGGTLDVSVVDYLDTAINIISVAGDNHLGGDDFDNCIMNIMKQQLGIADVETSAKETAILQSVTWQCKQSLVDIDSQFNYKFQGERLNGKIEIDGYQIVEACNDLFNRMYKIINKALYDANLQYDEIDNVILIGGGCKMHAVQAFVSQLFSREIKAGKSCDLYVGMGCGIYAGIRERNQDIKDYVLADICPFSLGVSIINRLNPSINYFSPIIERNTSLPTSSTRSYTPINDQQNSLEFHVLQGDCLIAEENKELGTIEIPIPPSGNRNVEVTFTYDINGILKVTAQNYVNQTTSIVLNNKGISDEEVKDTLQKFSNYKKTDIIQEEIASITAKAIQLFEVVNVEDREDIMSIIQHLGQVVNHAQSDVKKRKIIEETNIRLGKYYNPSVFNYASSFMQMMMANDDEE